MEAIVIFIAQIIKPVMLGKRERAMISVIWAIVFSSILGCNNSPGARTGDTNPVNKAPIQGVKTAIDYLSNWQPIVYDSTKKYIYLTFDDGPQHGTVDCYNLCKQQGIKASFFMVGVHTAQKSDGQQIVKMIRDSYPQFLLANHSYTHAKDKYTFFYRHPLMAEEDFYQAQDFLHVPYKIIRLPGNSAWVRNGEVKATPLVKPVTLLLDSAGYNIIGWEVEWNFNHKNARPVQTPEKLAAEVDSAFARNRTHVKDHVVILSHDRMFQRSGDLDSLAKFIRILKQNPSYVFETVDHYPGLKRPVYHP